MPHASSAPPLVVRVAGRAHELHGPVAKLGRLTFLATSLGWLVRDDGLSGGMFCSEDIVKQVLIRPGDDVSLRIGAFDGPTVNITAPTDELPPPAPPTPAKQLAPLHTPEPSHERKPASRPTLIARNLTVHSPDGAPLLRDVNLALEPGTLTAVIGPSGAGKSTLLHTLAGQMPIHTGGVWWRGHAIPDEIDVVRTQIGFVPQEQIQHSSLLVRQSLNFSARLRLPISTNARERARRIDDVIGSMGLGAQQKLRISSLSGGQQKRVSIATELLTSPPLLFLDEPTSGLDPGRELSVVRELRRLADESTGGQPRSVVMTTHSVLGLSHCDRVIVVAHGGRVVYNGSPDDVLEHFACQDYPELFTLLEEPDHGLQRLGPVRALVSRSRFSLSRSVPEQRHLRTLLARNLALIIADRLHLAMLLFMPLVLATLARIVPGDAGLSAPGEAGQRLTILVVAATLLGAATTIREVVQERSIYRREHAVGLSPGAYWSSKALVFGTICFIQGVAVTYLALLGLPRQPSSGVFGWGLWEIAIPIGLLASVMALVGLWLSALVRSAEQTGPVLIAIVMVQIVLSSTLVRIDGRLVFEQLAWLSPARWAHAAAAASVDLDRNRAVPDALYAFTTQAWAMNIGALFVLGIVGAWLGARAIARDRTT